MEESCLNCDGPHKINKCKAKCRVHKKYCYDKYQCYKEASPKPTTLDAPAVPVKKTNLAKAARATKKTNRRASEEDVKVSYIKIAKSAH